MGEEKEVKVSLSTRDAIEVLGKTWHFIVLIIGFVATSVWTVTTWRDTVEAHLKAIDDHLHTIDIHMQVEDQQLTWIIAHWKGDGIPPPQFDPQAAQRRPMRSHPKRTSVRPNLIAGDDLGN